jgi:hypothetical protein
MKNGRKPRLRPARKGIVERDLGVAIERALQAMDSARGGDPVELHRQVKIVRAMITASEMGDEERTWS